MKLLVQISDDVICGVAKSQCASNESRGFRIVDLDVVTPTGDALPENLMDMAGGTMTAGNEYTA